MKTDRENWMERVVERANPRLVLVSEGQDDITGGQARVSEIERYILGRFGGLAEMTPLQEKAPVQPS